MTVPTAVSCEVRERLPEPVELAIYFAREPPAGRPPLSMAR